MNQKFTMAKLYFDYSAMNAGKSTSSHNYHEHGMRTLLLTPGINERAGVGNESYAAMCRKHFVDAMSE